MSLFASANKFLSAKVNRINWEDLEIGKKSVIEDLEELDTKFGIATKLYLKDKGE